MSAGVGPMSSVSTASVSEAAFLAVEPALLPWELSASLPAGLQATWLPWACA